MQTQWEQSNPQILPTIGTDCIGLSNDMYTTSGEAHESCVAESLVFCVVFCGPLLGSKIKLSTNRGHITFAWIFSAPSKWVVRLE